MKRRRNTDLPQRGQAIMKLPTLPTISQINTNGIVNTSAALGDKPSAVAVIGTPHTITGIASTNAIMNRHPRR
jgi:hypothetical protein